MKKSKVVLAYLWPSLAVLATLSGLILVSWYPQPFLKFDESGKFALSLILAAVFFGPALIWFVYKKGKAGMVFDLYAIAIIQLAAIAWGSYFIYKDRPYFMVFTVDQFEVLSRWQVDMTGIDNPAFLDRPLTAPVLLYASMPRDPEGFQKFMDEVLFQGKPDLQFRPEFWSLYDEKKILVPDVAKPLEQLHSARPGSQAVIDKLVDRHGGDISRLSFVPAKSSTVQFAVVLDTHSGEVIDSLAVDPWLY
jgi:hypothetical protein